MERANLYRGELTILDYGIFISVLVISFSIGVFNGFRGKKTDEDFFVAGRSFGFLPVGMSLVVSFISSIAILGMTGEAYTDGIQFMSYLFGSFLGIMATYFVSVPVFYNLKVVSVNEYIGMRFQSPLLRKMCMVFGLMRKVLYLGLALYAPSLALSTVTPLNSTVCMFTVGVVCTLYSSFGGIRGVIWTDVFQLLTMIVGLSAVLVVAFMKIGGFHEFWTIGKQGGRLTLFNMNLSLYERHNFFNCFLLGFFFSSNNYITGQEVIQRLSTVKSLKDTKRTLWLCAAMNFVLYSCLLVCGVAIYVYYKGCDPLTLGVISKQDQILPLFIMQTTSFIHGFPGFFIGTILAATLSTLSSIMNGSVAILWKDFLQEMPLFKNMKPETARFTNRIMSIICGAVMIGAAFVASKGGRLNQLVYSISGAISGPVYGVFILGLFFPKCGSRGAFLGLVGSWIFIAWMSLGANLCFSGHTSLPLSADMCTNSSLTSETNMTTTLEHQPPWTHCERFVLLYKVSYTFHIVTGCLLCIILGLVCTKIADKSEKLKTAKHLVSPLIWQFFSDDGST